MLHQEMLPAQSCADQKQGVGIPTTAIEYLQENRNHVQFSTEIKKKQDIFWDRKQDIIC